MPDLRDQLQADLSHAYTLERRLGQGGMAAVFLAHDRKHDRRVALKILLPELASLLGTDRFLSEIRLTARLSHPHILPLLDSGEACGLPYYVTPYVDGESLRQRLDRERQLPVSDAVRIACHVADALDYAHAAGVVHRDIKPENVLLTGRHALVADFGIGRAMTSAGGERLTQSGLTVGTPTYMSPEQAAGEADLDGRSDIYSLGIVLFEMLAGAPPFTGPTIQAVIAKRFMDPAPPLRTVRQTVPEHVERAVLKALARTPADRFATAGELAQVLAPEDVADERSPSRVVTSTTAAAGAPSIAVLPFINMSSDPENEYFSDGITEEIINSLTQLRSVRVAARTSAFAFKGQSVDPRTVAERLDVRTVLTGSVRKAGNRLRIAVQLVNAADGFLLWSERFDRELRDVFAIQDEIAAAIVETLRVTLLGASPSRLDGRRTDNIEAYEIYLKGRYFWNQRGEGLRKGLKYFQRALELDPEYPLAHVGVADAYNLLAFYGYLPPRVAFPQAKAAALAALALDDTLAEAHGSLAYVNLFYEWNGEAGRRELERAIALNPSYVPARYWLAAYHMTQRRFDLSIEEDRRAVEIDPLSIFTNAHLGWMCYIARRPLDAIDPLQTALDLNPDYFLAHRLLGLCYLALDRHDDALAELNKAVSLSDRNSWTVADLGYALALRGDTREAKLLLDELEDRAARDYVAPIYIGTVYAALGELDAALDHLEQACNERDPWCVFGLMEPAWDAVRADSRFINVARTVGLAV